jgi:hypothetical protein
VGDTLDEAYSNSPPSGPNMIPTAKNKGRTVLGVRMGAYARSRCCRKAVLGGFRDFGFFSFLLSWSLLPASLLLSSFPRCRAIFEGEEDQVAVVDEIKGESTLRLRHEIKAGHLLFRVGVGRFRSPKSHSARGHAEEVFPQRSLTCRSSKTRISSPYMRLS